MPAQPTLAPTLALDLGDGQPIALSRFQPPPLHLPAGDGRTGSGVQPAWDDASARVALSGAGALLPLIHDAGQGQVGGLDGQVLVADANLKLKRALRWKGGRLSAVTFDALDAQQGRQALGLTVAWAPGRLSDAPASGTLKLPATLRKTLSPANFRVVGLPFDAAGVVRVELPALQMTADPARGGAPTVSVGEVQIELGGRSVEPARAWVQQALAPLDSGHPLPPITLPDLDVEVLDAALKQALARFSLQGLTLAGCSESAIDPAVDALPRLRLSARVRQLGVKLTGG